MKKLRLLIIESLVVGALLITPASPAWAQTLGKKVSREFVPGGDANGNGCFDPGDWVRYTVTVRNPTDSAATGVTIKVPVDRRKIEALRNFGGFNVDATDLKRIRWVNQTIRPHEVVTYSFDATVKARSSLKKPISATQQGKGSR